MKSMTVENRKWHSTCPAFPHFCPHKQLWILMWIPTSPGLAPWDHSQGQHIKGTNNNGVTSSSCFHQNNISTLKNVSIQTIALTICITIALTICIYSGPQLHLHLSYVSMNLIGTVIHTDNTNPVPKKKKRKEKENPKESNRSKNNSS